VSDVKLIPFLAGSSAGAAFQRKHFHRRDAEAQRRGETTESLRLRVSTVNIFWFRLVRLRREENDRGKPTPHNSGQPPALAVKTESRAYSRLTTVVLALRNTLATLGRRTAPTAPQRILIAHHLLLGDTLMLTPLLAKLRERYPAADIVMATPRPCAPLYAQQPYGIRAIAFDPRDPATLTALRAAGSYDLAIVPGDNRFAWLARAAGAKWVVAFAGDRPASKNWAVDELIPYPDAPAAWGDMVAGLVAGPAPRPYRTTDWPAPECAPFERPATPYCVLHVGASSPLKAWPTANWRALVESLERRGFSVVWSGGRGEDRLVAEIDPEGRYPSYAAKLNLSQLWHLLAGAGLLVCPDTGVAHLGRLTGTPTVTLFGPGSATICGAGDFWRDAPYRAVTVADFSCRNQNILFRRTLPWVRRCGRGLRECAAPACMQAITVNSVLEAVANLTEDAPCV